MESLFMKKFFCLGIMLGSFALLSAQEAITMPTMPSMPSMPAVGNGFYTPSTSGFYTGNAKQNRQKSKTATNNANQNAAENSESANANSSSAKTASTLDSAILTAATGTDLSSLSNLLTAKDISKLSNLGLLGNVENSLKKDSDLSKIISEIEKIKENTPSEQKKVSLSSANEKSEPKILRFNVDNEDCLKAIKEVFFSTESIEGTFLLTGDCKYSKDSTAHNETFYFLFKADGTEGGITRYAVSATVSQGTLNDSSFLRKIADAASEGKVSAFRTGNLVTFRIDDEKVKFDMLLAM